MKTTTAPTPYGYRELRSLHQRYMMFAMLFAISIELALIGGYRFSEWIGSSGDIEGPLQVFPPSVPYRNIPLPPSIFGDLPYNRTATVPVKVQNARPVPVKDNLADTTKTIASQTTLSLLPDPDGNILGSGNIIIEPPPDDNPAKYESLETYPVPVTASTPVYPEIALRAGMEGRVVVNVLLDKEGRVKQAVMLKRSDDIFVDPAIEAAKKWVFTPALMNGKPVKVWVTIPFQFKLMKSAK